MSNLLKYKGYHGSIAFSAEDGMLIGSVIGIQDSLNFHGSSVSEIEQSFHDCIDGYLEMCNELGKNPDKEYKGSFNIRISPALHREAEVTAKSAGLTLNQFVQVAIEEKVNQEKQFQRFVIVTDLTCFSTNNLSESDLRRNYNPTGKELSKKEEKLQWTLSTTLN